MRERSYRGRHLDLNRRAREILPGRPRQGRRPLRPGCQHPQGPSRRLHPQLAARGHPEALTCPLAHPQPAHRCQRQEPPDPAPPPARPRCQRALAAKAHRFSPGPTKRVSPPVGLNPPPPRLPTPNRHQTPYRHLLAD